MAATAHLRSASDALKEVTGQMEKLGEAVASGQIPDGQTDAAFHLALRFIEVEASLGTAWAEYAETVR